MLLLVGGCAESTAKTPTVPPPPVVQVTLVARQNVPLFTETVGTLDGYVNAEIRARVRGILQALHYKDGARVKEGQLLFTIDRSEFQNAVDLAKAALARSETGLAHNQAQLVRRQQLGAEKVVSRQEVEDAEAAARDSQDQSLAADAQLRQATLNLSYTQIRSPVAGVAGLAQVRVGNLVGQDGPTLLTTVSQVDPIRVSFPMSETDYVKAAERLKRLDTHDLAWARAQFKCLEARGGRSCDDGAVDLVLADGSTYAHRGVIVAVNRQVDSSTGTIQLQALFPNSDSLLRPGQYGRVRMRRPDVGGDALVVPEKALIQVQGTYSLAVVDTANKVTFRKVEVGPTAGPLRIITSGANPGDRVVVEGLQKVSDGLTVAPQPLAALPPAKVGAATGPSQAR